MLCDIVAYGILIGEDDSMESFLIVDDLPTIGRRMSPHDITTPKIPAKQQCLWQLTLWSLQHKGNYWCHHLSGNITQEFIMKFDQEIGNLIFLSTVIKLRNDETLYFTKACYRLPVSKKGLGEGELEVKQCS